MLLINHQHMSSPEFHTISRSSNEDSLSSPTLQETGKGTDLFLVVVRHLQPSPLETALDVKSLVGLATVKDGLVAADLLGDEVEGLDQAEP